MRALKRRALRGALDFDKVARFGHDHVEVRLGRGILGIVQVQQRLAGVNAHRYGGDEIVQWVCGDALLALESVDRIDQRHKSAGDGRRSRPAIGLYDIAIQRNGVLTELAEVHRGAQ